MAISIDPWLQELTRIQKELQQQLPPLLHHIAWYPVNSFHITLFFLGYMYPKARQQLQQKVQQELLLHPIAPFAIKASKLSLLSGRHIIVDVESDSLLDLYQVLKVVVPENVQTKNKRPFKPHLALGKFKSSKAMAIAQTVLGSYDINGLKPIEIKEFHLFESMPRRVYKPVISFPLEIQNAK